MTAHRMTVACLYARHADCSGTAPLPPLAADPCACVCHHVTHSTTDPPPCPECAAGKCGNCDGRTWDRDADDYTDCPCAGAGHG